MSCPARKEQGAGEVIISQVEDFSSRFPVPSSQFPLLVASFRLERLFANFLSKGNLFGVGNLYRKNSWRADTTPDKWFDSSGLAPSDLAILLL